MSVTREIADAMMGVIEARPPFPEVPASLGLANAMTRGGLSAMRLAANVISRLPEAGIPTGPNADGSENNTCLFVRVLSEAVVEAIKGQCSVRCEAFPMTAHAKGIATDAGGPAVIMMGNDTPVEGVGVIQ